MSCIEYRKDIDALRGISVFLVVIYHAFPNILPGGFIGVDVFFVISGYLITTIILSETNRNTFSLIEFYRRRIRRIFPSLFLVLFTSLVLGYIFLFPDEYKQLGYHVFKSTMFIQNFNLISELGYFDVSSHYKPLLHLWTLSIEEQYYIIWPLILITLIRMNFNSFKVLLVFSILSFTANVYFSTDYKNEVFFHSVSRFWELGLGSLLAIYLFNNPISYDAINKRTYSYIFTFGLMLILIPAFLFSGDLLYPYWIGLLPTTGALLIIISNVQLKNWGGMAWLGLISYPLYLWHWVIISFSYIYLGKKPDALTLMSMVAFSILTSYLTYKYIEKIRYIKSNNTVLVLLLFAITIGSIGFIVYKKEGAPNRDHLKYLDQFNVEFKRTPATDKLCDAYVSPLIQHERLFNYCRSNFVKKDGKLIAVIGDSHAHVLFPGIANSAMEHGFNTVLLANSSCPPLINFMWGRNPKEISDCQIKIDQILSVLKSDKRIEKIIFATRGPVYIHGEVKGKFTKESVRNSLQELTHPDKQTYDHYFEGFDQTLYSINEFRHVENVYYFLENPELDFLPKEIIPRPFDYWGMSILDYTIDRNLYKMRMHKYRALAIEKVSKYSKAVIIDVEPYLCEGDVCSIYKEGNFLYADDDHFSVFGSNYIARKTEDVLFQ